MDLKKRIFNSSFYRLISNLVTITVIFLLTPYLIEHLGEDDYGLWLLIISILGWFRMLELGLPEAVQRQITIALETEDDKRVNSLFSSSVIIFVILGISTALLVIILGRFPAVLGVGSENFRIVELALLILSLKVCWDFMMNSIHGFYSGLIRYDIDANIHTVNEIIRAVLIYFLIREMHIFGVVVATMVADLVTNLFKVIYLKRLHSNLKFNTGLVDFSEIRSLISYAKYVTPNTVALSLSGRVNPFIISHLFGLGSVAVYSIASRLVDNVEKLFLSVLGVFQPVFVRILERKGEIDFAVKQVVSLNLFLVSAFFIPLIILSGDFIYLWLGEGFEESATLVKVLCFAFLCKTISRPISEALLATANHKYLSAVNLTGLIINITISVILAINFGLIGVALGSIVGFYLSDLILHLLMYKKFISTDIKVFITGFISTNIFVLISGIAGLLYFESVPRLAWPGLIAWAMMIFTAAAWIFWVLLLEENAKYKIHGFFMSSLNKSADRK